MQYDKLIFVQAAADLQHALFLCNEKEKIKICVVNVKTIYEYLKGLNLKNIELSFYPYIEFNIKKPKTYFKAKKELELKWLTDFETLKVREVYFFSRFYDWFTASLMVSFSKQNKASIIYYDHYDDLSVKNDLLLSIFTFKGLRLKVRAWVHSFISGANFTAKHCIRNLEFRFDLYNIKKITAPKKVKVKEEYLYKINTNNKPMILFFLSPGELEMLNHQSKEIVKDIIKEYKQKECFLVLKGHPRLGNPEEFIPYFDVLIPNNVPSEFVSYSNITMVVGIISTALNFATNIEGVKVISLINLLEFKNSDKKAFYSDYLKELSNNKISFVNTIKDQIALYE